MEALYDEKFSSMDPGVVPGRFNLLTGYAGSGR
jgi:hypothetical protein